MKNQITLLLILFLTSFAFSQNSCSKYYPFDQGTTSQITTYDKKGKVAAMVDYKVESVTKAGGKEVANINSTVKDDKGEVIAESNYDVICTEDKISIDFNSLINPQLFQQFGNMEYEVTGTNIDLPNNLSVVQSLPDADMQMKVNMGGINMNINLSMTDRKVTGKENVTTPAGTFDCFVIEYTLDIKMGMNRTSTAKQWIAEGVGMVKQEDYNKKGKVTSSSLLTAFSK